MPFSFLLAMQAAGMITDFIGSYHQQQLMKMGANIQQEGIEAQIQSTRLEAEDASLQAMKNLRQGLGTQLAVQAARGTRSGAGSAMAFTTQAISSFNEDEKIRRLNALGKENQLRAGAAISRLNYMSNSSKMWQGFASRTFNTFGTGGFGGFGSKAGNSQGFGLTSA